MPPTRQAMTIATATCTAALLLGALASTAAAAEWKIKGIAKAGKLAEATTVTERFELSALGILIVCDAVKLKEGMTILPSVMLIKSVEFDECKETMSGCRLSKAEINTVPLVTEEVVKVAPLAVKLVFKPETKNTIATIKFEGTGCVLPGVQPIKGKVTAQGPTMQVENVKQLLTINSVGELELGASAATLKVAAEIELAPAEKWSFN